MAVQNVSPFMPETSPKELSIYNDFSEEVVLDVAATQPFKLLVAGVGGDIEVEGIAGNTIFWPAASAGQPIPIRGVKVLSAHTTAGGIHVYWGL